MRSRPPAQSSSNVYRIGAVFFHNTPGEKKTIIAILSMAILSKSQRLVVSKALKQYAGFIVSSFDPTEDLKLSPQLKRTERHSLVRSMILLTGLYENQVAVLR
jgi:hypothetical protein